MYTYKWSVIAIGRIMVPRRCYWPTCFRLYSPLSVVNLTDKNDEPVAKYKRLLEISYSIPDVRAVLRNRYDGDLENDNATQKQAFNTVET